MALILLSSCLCNHFVASLCAAGTNSLLADAMDLTKPPKDIWQAAARNDTNFIKRSVERTLEFDM